MKLNIFDSLDNLKKLSVKNPDGSDSVGDYGLVIDNKDNLIVLTAANDDREDSYPDIVQSGFDIAWLKQSRGYQSGGIPKGAYIKIAGEASGYRIAGDPSFDDQEIYHKEVWNFYWWPIRPSCGIIYNDEYYYLTSGKVFKFDWGNTCKNFAVNEAAPGDGYNCGTAALTNAGKILKTYGGSSGDSNQAALYNIATDSWDATGNLPQSFRFGISAVDETNGYVYIIGCYSVDSWKPWVFRYSISGNSWSQLSDLPNADFQGSGGSVNIGGTNWFIIGGNASYKFNTSTEIFNSYAATPLSRSQAACVLFDSLNNLVYHIHGKSIAYFDLVTNTWSDIMTFAVSENHYGCAVWPLAKDFYLVISHDLKKVFVMSPHKIKTMKKY